MCEDCNFDIGLLQWGLGILSREQEKYSCDVFGSWDYKQALQDLAGPPIGPNGWLIGANVSLTEGHRHYSHLFNFFPLRNVRYSRSHDGETAQNKLIERSVDHWYGLRNVGEGFTGFSYVATGIMSMWMGRNEGNF